MPRKPIKSDDPEQSKRFLEIAEEVGADADDKALERAFKKITPSDRPQIRRKQKNQESQ